MTATSAGIGRAFTNFAEPMAITCSGKCRKFFRSYAMTCCEQWEKYGTNGNKLNKRSSFCLSVCSVYFRLFRIYSLLALAAARQQRVAICSCDLLCCITSPKKPVFWAKCGQISDGLKYR